jgi:hypothetical protein
MPTQSYKKHRRNGLYSYYRLLSDRQPPACERLIFLNPTPAVDFSEYDLSQAGSLIEYRAILANGDPIDAAEYAAYKRATIGEFTLYINGQPQ